MTYFSAMSTRCCYLRFRGMSSVARPESYLVIPGALGRQVDTIVKPVINTNQLSDVSGLQENLELRGINGSAQEVIKMWDNYALLNGKVNEIEMKRKENSKKMEAIKIGENWKSDPLLIELRNSGVSLRNDFKAVSKELEKIEVSTLLEVLSLPNDVCKEQFETRYFGEKPLLAVDPDQNVEPAVKSKHPFFYFSKDNAVLELKLCKELVEFLKSKTFAVVSPPDFVKSAIVEGCGISYEDVFTLNEPEASDPLRVVGGASLPGICTLFTRTVIRNKPPLRFCALGRRYNPTVSPTLTDSAQKTAVQTLSLVDSTMLTSEVENLTNCLTEFYSSLGLHFRVSKTPFSELKRFEMSRVRLEMFSVTLGRYVEVAGVSKLGDFVSRRLAIRFHPFGEGVFVNLVSATAIDFQALMHCWHESGRPDLPCMKNAA